MKLLTFKSGSEYRLGIFSESGIIDVAAAQNLASHAGNFHLPETPAEFFSAGLDFLPALKGLRDAAHGRSGDWLLPVEDIEWGPVVPNPGKILCVGLNYQRHAAESNMAAPTTPILFSKFNNAIAAHNEGVPVNPGAEQIDYEAELVVVMGKSAHNIAAEEALDAVLGYCNGNDLSARDLQFRTPQWLLGKTLDKFLPIGPYLVTADDVPDPQALSIRAWLNGELRQDSSTADMIFPVREIISYASRYISLESGDIIATGTPEGVILGKKGWPWMKAGDVTTVEIEGLGRLENRMV